MENSTITVVWAGDLNTSEISVDSDETSIPPSDDEVLYLYLDEFGNFDFSEKGTDHFIMTCVAVKRPFSAAHALLDLRYDFLEEGLCIERFHACEDVDGVKSAVYDRITSNRNGMRTYIVCLDKELMPEETKNAKDIYALSFALIMDEVKAKECTGNTKLAVVVTDRLPKEAERKAVDKPIKAYMKREFQNAGIPYSLMHHSSSCDPNLQIADYMCWAVQRRIVRGKDWPLCKVKEFIKEIGYAFSEKE